MPKLRSWLLPLLAAAVALSASACGGTSTSASARRILFFSDRGGAWALYSMNLNGGDQRRALGHVGQLDPGAEGVGIGVPILMPDGREVLLPRRGITTVTLATGARRRIAAGEENSVVWSHDGHKFLYSGRRIDSAQMYTIDLRTGRKRTLPGTWNAAPAGWSPDGKWILFVRQHGYGSDYLWRVRPNGQDPRRITGYAPDSDIHWLPDGRAEFIGTRGNQSTGRLVVLDLHSGKVTILGTLLTPDSSAWSPDGRTMVYAARKNQSKPPAIYTMSLNGGNRHRLTPKGKDYYDESPVWSPDGKNIAFMRYADSGAQRYAQEIWTMHADGSHQRKLTEPYPDGGDNIYPIWIEGPVKATGEPQPSESRQGSRSLLRVPYLVDGVAAQARRSAVIPFGYDQAANARQTPPLLVWRPGSRPEPLVASLCGSVPEAVFAGQRLAIECAHDFLDEHNQAMLVYNLRTRVPVAPIFAFNSFFGRGTQSGTILAGPVVSGGRLEFASSHWIARSKKSYRTKLQRETLWSIDGSHGRIVRSAHRLGTLIAGDRDWLVFQLDNDNFAVGTPSGRPSRMLRLPPLHLSLRATPAGFLMAGHELIRLGDGRLEAWDVRNGHVLLNRSVPALAHLQAADGRLIVYTVGSDIHILSRRGERVIHTPATGSRQLSYYGQFPLHAAVSAAGLFYAYDVKGSHFPGRVVFVPRSALPH